MKSFDVKTLIDIHAYLALIEGATLASTDVMPEKIKTQVLNDLPKVEEECTKLGLNLSAITANRMKTTLLTKDLKYAAFNRSTDEFIQRVNDEVKSKLFFCIEPDKQRFLIDENLFGGIVAEKFPSTVSDINSAGRCLAFDQGTASVFHSMRILEKGLQILAKTLGVRYDNTNWGSVILNIETEIKKIDKNTAGDGWKEKEKFYSEAALQFRYFKNAWRNYVMHAIDIYDDQQAESIFQHVKEFMNHLATELQEN